MIIEQCLSHPRHPFDTLPFEVFHDGSWWVIENAEIKSGSIIIKFDHHGLKIEKKVISDNLRIRSRKAVDFDCCYFLRPGVDVCVFSSFPNTSNQAQGKLQWEWNDAKIVSIERKPHKYQCHCRFFVSFYRESKMHGVKKNLFKRGMEEVTIENVAILQKLNSRPYENGNFCWKPFEDCASAQRCKLSSGTFCSEVSWLIVISILKGINFDIRLIQNKIIYLVLNGFNGSDRRMSAEPTCNSNSDVKDFWYKDQKKYILCIDQNVMAISFQRSKGVLQPKIEIFPFPEEDMLKMDHIIHDLMEVNCNPFYDVPNLRRSKRLKYTMEDSVGYGGCSNMKCSSFRYRHTDHFSLQDNDISIIVNCLKQEIKNEKRNQNLNDDPNDKSQVTQIRKAPRENICSDSKQHMHSGLTVEIQDQCQFTENCVNDRHILDRKKITNQPKTKGMDRNSQDPIFSPKWNRKRQGINDFLGCHPKRPKNSESFGPSNHFTSFINGSSNGSLNANNETWDAPKETCLNKLSYINCSIPEKKENNSQSDDFWRKNPAMQRKKISKSRYSRFFPQNSRMLDENKKITDSRSNQPAKDRQKRQAFHGEVQKTNLFSKRNCYSEMNAYSKKYSSASEYNQMLSRFMEIIQSEREKQNPVDDVWFKPTGTSNLWKDIGWSSFLDHQAESLEQSDLWQDMEDSLATLRFTVGNQESSAEHSCQHKYILDEEIGIICRLCKIVDTEIKYILPPFLEKSHHIRIIEQSYGEGKLEGISDLCSNSYLGTKISSWQIQRTEKHGTVWSLIPEIERKMHMHQKNSFEFLWKNIAGSLNMRNMDQPSEKTGGCVISHAPGTGKTLLVISFLVSYLGMFPRNRPLILVPKVTLYTWCTEFDKWKVSVPVYIIDTCKNYKPKMPKGECLAESPGGIKPSQEVMHMMDCLEKLQKWHERPSLLLMSYTCFFSLTRGDSKLGHRRHIAQVLIESPGIMVLDEGHNPRSTKSKLRHALMKVKTSLRILLSGTLFQNNFEEYFNTLCLARPSFISELQLEFDPKKGRREGVLSEKSARSIFIEEIAKKIDSGIEEDRERGLGALRKLTSRFIDIYEGEILESLPGLQTYTALLKPTTLQWEIIKRLQGLIKQNGRNLEVELLITVASIHPWLIKTIGCADKYLNLDELDLDKFKNDVKQGSKAKFVIDLLQLCIIKSEKVLIFCRNIPPIKFFIEIFKIVFKWSEGEEVLMIHGDQNLLQRENTMNKFNNGRATRVLLASTLACAEGINLTAASRLVLLDSEWNPSKTKQAIARAFRLGQERLVYVYQLLAFGTFEEEKYGRTVWKGWLSRMVFQGGNIKHSSSYKQVESVQDDVLRKLVEDETEMFQTITTHEGFGNKSSMKVKMQNV